MSAIKVVEVEDDYNIQEAWNRACGAFAQTTKVNLTESPKFTVDEVLDQIRAKQDEDDEKRNKYRVTKDVIGKTLKFITVLGGIAAQGASMVFAPSSLCFNAISYLISTGAKYKRIFSSLAELFRKVSDVLERCKIYLRLPAEAVDIALRKIINEELVCFVDICALSIKVLKGNKILTALKVFAFDSDEGVSGQLGRLAALVERESQMRATLGFESQKISEKAIAETRDGTKKVTASVDKLLTFEKKKDADTTAQRLLSNIDSNLNNPSEAFKDVQAIFKRYLDSQVPDSGNWLQQDSQYTTWVDTQQPGCSILGLAGNEGYGKSFLFTTIVKELQERHTQATAEENLACTAAGYYFFDQDKKDESLIRALEVLAWQLAKVDIVYRKDLSAAKTAGINQIGPLCEKMFEWAYKSDSTFFLLLDGLDHMDKQHLKEFVQVLARWRTAGASWPRFTLRILLTARSETMEKIRTDLEDEISAINIATKNRDDMVKFINDRMDKMDILSGSSDQISSLRSEILESLTEGTSGDFVQVGLLLDDISGKQRPGEIRDILSRSGENRSDTIVRKIDYLNDSLSDEDISDLNTLLTWVVNALRPLTLEELEAVLFLKSREPSLRPLGEKIRDQYSSIFRIAAACVYLVSGSIGDFLLEGSGPEGEDSSASLDDTGDVNEAEVRIVSRFLNSVCDPQLFKKFGFEEFFQRKLKGKSVRVGIDSETAHLTIVSGCLDVICSRDAPELDPLLDYATNYFGEHLEKVDPSLTLPRQKMSLGPQLVMAFTDDDVINRWWSLSNPWLHTQWIYGDHYPDIVLKWLQDSAVTKEISEEQSKWVKSLSSKSDLDADVLEHIGKGLARRWLQSGDAGVAFMFDSAHGYISKIKARKDPSVTRQTSDPGADDIKPSDILDAAKWAQEILGLEALDYEESRNLARTLRDYGKYDEALEQFKHTSTLSKINWLSVCGLAECYASSGNYAAAIETLEAVKKTMADQIEDPEEREAEVVVMNLDLAAYNNQAGQDDVALEIYENRLKEIPYDYETALKLVMLLHKLQKHSRILEFLQSMESEIDEVSGLNLRLTNFHTHYYEEEYHHAMFATVSNDVEFNIMFDFYQEAIATAKTRLAKSRKVANIREEWALQLCLMELMSRVALLSHKHSSGNPDRTKFALEQWLRVLEFNATDDGFIAEKQAIVRSQYAIVCFENIQKDPENAAEWLSQLEHINSVKTVEYEGDWFQGKHPAALLARQYALQGDHQKAKDLLRSSVKINMDLLSDDDEANDYQGYNGLAMYLMFAGQDADALAAWSLITPNKNETSDETTESGEPVLKGSLGDFCDGPGCDTHWTYANDFYVCKVCNYISFDQACLDKLNDGAATEHLCNTSHERLHIPPYDAEELAKIGEGNVKVGDEIMTVDEWLKKIRKDWGIESV